MRYLLLLIVLGALSASGTDLEKCSDGYEQVLPRYTSLFSPAAVAPELRGDLTKPFYKASPVSAPVPGQPPLVFRVGQGTAGERLILTMSQDNREIADVRFVPSGGGTKLFISESHTHRGFERRGAYDAMTRTVVALYPECTEISSQLAWTNFRRVAELLSGQEMTNVSAQEAVIARAASATDKTALLEAIRLSPRGVTMKNSGFVLDPASVVFTSTDRSFDYTPMLSVRWVKSASPKE